MQQPIEIFPDISRINSIPFPDSLRKTSLRGDVGSVNSWKEWQDYLARVGTSNLPTALRDIDTVQAYIEELKEGDNDEDMEPDIETLEEFLGKMKLSLSARTGAPPTLSGSLSSSGFTAAGTPLNILQIFENKATEKSLETDEYLSQVTKESLTLDQHSGIVTCTKNKNGLSSWFADERSFDACIIRGNSITLTPSLFSSSAPTPSSSNHASPPGNPAQQDNIKNAFRIAATLIAKAAPAGSTILIHGRPDEMTIERIRASTKIFEKHNLHYEITQDLATALALNPLEEKDQDFLSGIQIHTSGPSPSSPSSPRSPTPNPFGGQD